MIWPPKIDCSHFSQHKTFNERGIKTKVDSERKRERQREKYRVRLREREIAKIEKRRMHKNFRNLVKKERNKEREKRKGTKRAEEGCREFY